MYKLRASKYTKVNVPKVLKSFTSNYYGSDCNELDTYDEVNKNHQRKDLMLNIELIEVMSLS